MKRICKNVQKQARNVNNKKFELMLTRRATASVASVLPLRESVYNVQ